MRIFRRVEERMARDRVWWFVIALAVCGGVLFVVLRRPEKPGAAETPKGPNEAQVSSLPDAAPSVPGANDRSRAPELQNWDSAVDLLKAVKVYKGTVTGSWRLEDGKLTVERSDAATLELPYVPPQEYDFSVVFSVAREGGSVGQILYANQRQFGWYMGAYTNRYFGFQMIDGKAMPVNSTGVKVEQCLQPNQPYTSLVEVRKDGVRAYLNGKLISQYKTDYQDMSLFDSSRLRSKDVLGLWSADLATTFHSVRVREVTGKGKVQQDEAVPAEF